jgi:hypothetical protein
MNTPQYVKLVEIDIRIVTQDGETLMTRCKLQEVDISRGSPQEFRTRALDSPLKGLLRKMVNGKTALI